MSVERSGRDPTNADMYYLLGEINSKLTILVDHQSKTILALIALAAATLGLKVMGSPPLQVAMFYSKAFIFVFTLLMALYKRHKLRNWYWIFGFAVSALAAQMMGLLIGRETTFGTGLFWVANLCLLIFVWTWEKWEGGNDEPSRDAHQQ